MLVMYSSASQCVAVMLIYVLVQVKSIPNAIFILLTKGMFSVTYRASLLGRCGSTFAQGKDLVGGMFSSNDDIGRRVGGDVSRESQQGEVYSVD